MKSCYYFVVRYILLLLILNRQTLHIVLMFPWLIWTRKYRLDSRKPLCLLELSLLLSFTFLVILWWYLLALKNKFLIDPVYSNTRVPTQVNTSQHESTRVNTNQHESNTSQHESNTSQHESNTSQHESDTSQHESTRVQNRS